MTEFHQDNAIPADLSLATPGHLPTQISVMPHPYPTEKRVIVRLARPGASLMVELTPEDARQFAGALSGAAQAAASGLVLPTNGQELHP